MFKAYILRGLLLRMNFLCILWVISIKVGSCSRMRVETVVLLRINFLCILWVTNIKIESFEGKVLYF